MVLAGRANASREAAASLCLALVGGASIIQQALAAGLVDKLFLHLAPVILNSGIQLFERPAGRSDPTGTGRGDRVPPLWLRPKHPSNTTGVVVADERIGAP